MCMYVCMYNTNFLPHLQPNGSLHLTSLTTDDSGVYTCSAMVFDQFGFVNDLDENQRLRGENFTLMELNRAEIHVRTTPGAVASFTCRATTIIGKHHAINLFLWLISFDF